MAIFCNDVFLKKLKDQIDIFEIGKHTEDI